MLQLADALPAPRQPPRQPRRAAVAAELPRRRRPPAHQAHGQGADGLARPPAVARRRAAQAGHDRRAGRAARAHEPAPRSRVAALPRHRRRPRGRRRLALEDRPDDALRRLRPVAARVVDDAPARHRRAGAGGARHRTRADGVGHPAGGRAVAPAARAVGSRCSTTSATSCTSSSRGRRRRPRPGATRRRDAPCLARSTTRSQLALHELRAGAGRPLLLLHGLGERTPDAVPATWRPGRARCGGSTSPATATRTSPSAAATSARS